VRWDNGRESLITPAAGELSVVAKPPAAKPKAAAAKRPATRARPPKS
jgi:hypothetical protein